MGKARLRREVQCAKCPWRAAVDPNEIPNGYSVEKHRALDRTIAEPGALNLSLRAMACHESAPADEDFCVGWLMHQLGPGNNIGLRIKMLDYDLSRVKTVGRQHGRFEDTLP
jgi:hypothetical protein